MELSLLDGIGAGFTEGVFLELDVRALYVSFAGGASDSGTGVGLLLLLELFVGGLSLRLLLSVVLHLETRGTEEVTLPFTVPSRRSEARGARGTLETALMVLLPVHVRHESTQRNPTGSTKRRLSGGSLFGWRLLGRGLLAWRLFRGGGSGTRGWRRGLLRTRARCRGLSLQLLQAGAADEITVDFRDCDTNKRGGALGTDEARSMEGFVSNGKRFLSARNRHGTPITKRHA